jgi:hypothetical protein
MVQFSDQKLPAIHKASFPKLTQLIGILPIENQEDPIQISVCPQTQNKLTNRRNTFEPRITEVSPRTESRKCPPP